MVIEFHTLASLVGEQTTEIIYTSIDGDIEVATLHSLTIHLYHTSLIGNFVRYFISGRRQNPLATSEIDSHIIALRILDIHVERLDTFSQLCGGLYGSFIRMTNQHIAIHTLQIINRIIVAGGKEQTCYN